MERDVIMTAMSSPDPADTEATGQDAAGPHATGPHATGQDAAGADGTAPGADGTALPAIGLAPVGTPDGEPVTARRYAHPLLGARPMVRLTGGTCAPVEDRLLADIGFSAPDAGEPVATGARPALAYPEWALVHDLRHAERALDAAVRMARAGRLLASRPGEALEEFDTVAASLPADHLPLYWEEVARIHLRAGGDRQAMLAFGRARAADAAADAAAEASGAVTDPARRSTVFLEFALAGAVSTKDVTAYGKQLGQEDDPARAYQELRQLAVQRTLAGLPPWPQMVKQLGALARAAGLDPVAEHRLLLEGLLAGEAAPALWRAPKNFWTAQRKQLLPAVAASALLRQRLPWQLTTLPSRDLDGWWCTLLADSGALDDLAEDGAGPWLSAMLGRYAESSDSAAPEELLRLLPQLAPRIRAAGTPVCFGPPRPNWWYYIDAAALGRCLDAGIPVADPGPGDRMSHWQQQSGTVLRTLLDDERFGPVLRRSVPTGGDEFRALWRERALHPVLTGIVRERLHWAREGGLGDTRYALWWMESNLGKQVREVLPDLLDLLGAVDLVAPLTRALRAGILDELGWPALEEAAAELKGDAQFRASWPALTVHDRRKAIAVGPRTRLAEYRFRKPADDVGEVHAFFSDGQFLVCTGGYREQEHYWSAEPDRTFSVPQGVWHSVYYGRRRQDLGYTFMAPNGRRFMGHEVLQPGEQRLQPDGRMFHDGHTFWWLAKNESLPSAGGRAGWTLHPVDLLTGELGAEGVPDFFDPDLLREGERWSFRMSSLAPLQYGVSGSPLGSDGRFVGLRIAESTGTGRLRYHRADGLEGTLHPSVRRLWGLLDLPGADKPLALSETNHPSLVAQDVDTGITYWSAARMNDDIWASHDPADVAAGTPLIPPPAFFHFLTPRDRTGSLALRRISEDTVRGLLKAAAASDAELHTAVQSLLPEVTHPRLRQGIAGCVQEARSQLADRDTLLRHLSAPVVRRIKAPDADLREALEGLLTRYTSNDEKGLKKQIENAAAYFSGTIDAEIATKGWGNDAGTHDWTELAGRIGGLAVRAVSPVTRPAHRHALIELLRFWSRSPLAEPGLRYGLLKGDASAARRTGQGALMPVHVSFLTGEWARTGARVEYGTCVFLQRGDVPRPDGVLTVMPVPGSRATPERLEQLVTAFELRGPVAFDADAAVRLAGATGLDRATATLLLTGLPDVPYMQGGRTYLTPEVRKTLGLRAAEALTARDRMERIPEVDRMALYDAALPDDPEDLWNPATMADRLAQAWQETVGNA